MKRERNKISFELTTLNYPTSIACIMGNTVSNLVEHTDFYDSVLSYKKKHRISRKNNAQSFLFKPRNIFEELTECQKSTTFWGYKFVSC